MVLIHWLNQRLSLPEDTDTQRAKKVAAWLAGAGGLAVCLVIALINLAAGLNSVAALYFALAVFMIIAIVGLTLYPQHYYGLVFATSVVVTVHPWLIHLASGGFQSGLAPMTYVLFGPVASLLLIGARPALFNMGLLIISAVAATALEPWAATRAAPISAGLRQTIGLFNVIASSVMVFAITFFLYLEAERARAISDNLLLNMLPASIAQRLKRDSAVIAERHPDVTILFADIVDFTPMSVVAEPDAIVGLLNAVFSDFDDLADRYGLEKIKTIGDAYMVVGGLPEPRPDHCEAVAAFAVDMLHVVKRHRALSGGAICLRVGINTGPVVAGVIGHRKFSYDLWGDAVNTASRMESHALEDTIQVTEAVRERLAGRYEFETRGPIFVKGKGEMVTFLLKQPEPVAMHVQT